MKVYIVTSGEYSDYHIDRVFSTEAKAREFVEHMGNQYDIEEYDLDEETPRGVFGYHVTFMDNSDVVVEKIDFGTGKYNRNDTLQWSKFCKNRIWFNVEAKDAPHAVKIASERFMQIKAMPYLFPRLKEECVAERFFSSVNKTTPVYDYNTKKILLTEHEWIIKDEFI